MKRNIDSLSLDQTYSFDVVVDNHGTKFGGKLNLSPGKCTLLVSGEISQGRQANFEFENVSRIVCRDVATTFILLNLKATHFFSGVLERHPATIKTFEIGYEISYVICTRSTSHQNARFFGFKLNSSSIAQWIGETKTQHEIISKFSSGKLFSDGETIPFEFEQPIDGIGALTLGYDASMHFSTSEFSAGVQFPPRLAISFDKAKSELEVIEIFNALLDLLSVVVGGKISLKAINLIPENSSGFFQSTLYFSEHEPSTNETSYVMFPLGCNPARNQLGLPEFPLASFNAYFSASSEIRTYFKKYVRYRALKNPEERFLGYFRLLEKLTFRKNSFVDEARLDLLLTRAKSLAVRHFGSSSAVNSLFKQVRRANQSKLNTASCINKFMKQLPAELSAEWIFDKSHVESICKLRNDLTHANEIEPTTQDVEVRARFIEVLLVIALLKAIDIPVESMTSISPRMAGYNLIRKRAVPTLVTVTAPKDKRTT